MINRAITITAAVVAAPLVGGLLSGLDRKLTARMQGRIGPPVLQPFYDVLKLMGKEPFALNATQIGYAYLHLAYIIMVFVLLGMGQDLLMILFAHAFSTVSLVVGGMSVRSPYSRIGSQRKIMQMLAYEPILVLLVVGIYCITGSFQSGAVWAADRPLLLSLPLVFLAYLAAMQVKLEKSPFDVATSHHAHQELVKGLTIEYSGPYLALIEITQFYEIALVVAIVAMFWSTNVVIGAGLALLSFFLAILADNLTARVTTVRMVRYFWTVPLALAITNIIWLYAARGGAR